MSWKSANSFIMSDHWRTADVADCAADADCAAAVAAAAATRFACCAMGGSRNRKRSPFVLIVVVPSTEAETEAVTVSKGVVSNSRTVIRLRISELISFIWSCGWSC